MLLTLSYLISFGRRLTSPILCSMSSLGLLLWLLHVMTSFSMTSAFLSQKATYRAAVYSHRPVFPGHGLVDRSTAVRNVMKNVEIYKQQAILAAKQVSGSHTRT